MVRPMYRSRARARRPTRLPGNRTTVHYEKRRPSIATCPITGAELHGVPRVRPAQMRKLPLSQRRPNRMYGGKVSHTALMAAIRAKVLSGMTIRAVEIVSSEAETPESEPTPESDQKK
jgi:large subunit ribosomal protein L34e